MKLLRGLLKPAILLGLLLPLIFISVSTAEINSPGSSQTGIDIEEEEEFQQPFVGNKSNVTAPDALAPKSTTSPKTPVTHRSSGEVPATKSKRSKEANGATTQCLAEVRETMGREGIKQLKAGDQKKVTRYCKRGDVNRATSYVMLIGAYQRCTRNLDAHIEENNLDVAKDVRSRAYSTCRRGNLRKAIEVVAGAATKELATPAEIISFVASSSKVKKGDSVTLSWQTANANTVMLGRAGTSDLQDVLASGSQSVSPDKTTKYVLLAGRSTKGPVKMESKTLLVNVIYDPTIGRFSATPSTIRRGLKSKLTWDVYAADRVTINGKPVSPSGDQVVSPERTKTYTLMVRTGDQVIKEYAKVSVSPFKPPKLSPEFKSVELCKEIDVSGESYRCVSPDGPFWIGDEIHVIVRFKNIPRGVHRMERMIYSRSIFANKWRKINREESSFTSSKTGYVEMTFEIPNSEKGFQKLSLVLDGKKSSKSEIPYCVECPGHDEW